MRWGEGFTRRRFWGSGCGYDRVYGCPLKMGSEGKGLGGEPLRSVSVEVAGAAALPHCAFPRLINFAEGRDVM